MSVNNGRPARRRVVVTGLGAVSPSGIGVKAFWEALRDGIAVYRAKSNRLKDQQIERALWQIGFGGSHLIYLSLLPIICWNQ